MAHTLDELVAQLEAAAGGKLREYLLRKMTAAGLTGEGVSRLAATTAPRARTGRLRSSITSFTTQSPGAIELHLQAGGGRRPVAYAGLQEYGGTVRPRNGQYLAVPLPEARTAAGALRARFAVPGGLRMVPGLFLIRSRSGNLILVERRGKRGGLRALFVLKTETTVRGHHYLQAGADAAVKALPALVRESIETVVVP